MKLSIVIPIYNCAAFLSKCLDSCVHQYAHTGAIEIIAVNDGSTDDTAAILDGYDWRGVPHTVLSQSNAGLSAARNAGLDVASGEYVWFVDSDDWIDSISLDVLLPLLDGCDAVHFSSYYEDYEDGCSPVVRKDRTTNGIGRSEIFMTDYHFMACLSVFRRSFLQDKGLRFRPGILMEDMHFIPRALFFAESIKVSEIPVYHYLQRKGSIMKSAVSRKACSDRMLIARELNDFMTANIPMNERKAWSDAIAVDMNALAYDAMRSGNPDIIAYAGELIAANTSLLRYLRHSRNVRNRIWYFLSVLAGNRYFQVYKILFRLRY